MVDISSLFFVYMLLLLPYFYFFSSSEVPFIEWEEDFFTKRLMLITFSRESYNFQKKNLMVIIEYIQWIDYCSCQLEVGRNLDVQLFSYSTFLSCNHIHTSSTFKINFFLHF